MKKTMVWMYEHEITENDEKGKPVKKMVLTEEEEGSRKKIRVAYYR